MHDQAPQAVKFSEAVKFWFKLGIISFGGPAGQIAVMHQELVEKRRWLSERRFLHALNYCMLLPGPEAQQLATYIGWLMHRTWGGIIAGLLFILPSLVLLVALSWIYMRYGNVSAVAAILYGIKPAVTAIVLFAAYRIGKRALKNWLMWLIAGLAFLAIFVLQLPFPLIVLIAALTGVLGVRLIPDKFSLGGAHLNSNKSFGVAIIDDDTPVPDHARFNWLGFFKVALAGLVLWLSVMGLIGWNFGWQGALTQMAWFFTKAALLTFGGAYAVLPYVNQAAVEHFHWLTATQMMDGLALGETTPGPLIMVVTFVGFLAGWQTMPLGHDYLLMGATLAAIIVTYFTFLPSFIFVLAGAPFMESTHGNLKFTAPLAAVTAAVVGVIVNLAVFFALHVFWPHGVGADFDGVAAVIGGYALIALIRYKAGVISVIGVSALAGWLVSL